MQVLQADLTTVKEITLARLRSLVAGLQGGQAGGEGEVREAAVEEEKEEAMVDGDDTLERLGGAEENTVDRTLES